MTATEVIDLSFILMEIRCQNQRELCFRTFSEGSARVDRIQLTSTSASMMRGHQNGWKKENQPSARKSLSRSLPQPSSPSVKRAVIHQKSVCFLIKIWRIDTSTIISSADLFRDEHRERKKWQCRILSGRKSIHQGRSQTFVTASLLSGTLWLWEMRQSRWREWITILEQCDDNLLKWARRRKNETAFVTRRIPHVRQWKLDGIEVVLMIIKHRRIACQVPSRSFKRGYFSTSRKRPFRKRGDNST